MVTNRFAAAHAALWATVVWTAAVSSSNPTQAQTPVSDAVRFQVSGAAQRLEMIVNTSRILTVEHNVPRLLVQNPEILQATPLSPNQIQVSALKPGVTAVNMWDERNNIHVVDVHVLGDVRELQENLKALFPNADITLRPLSASLVLTGYVPRPDMVHQVVNVAQDYYPKVINQLNVGGAQIVLLHVKIMEVSRTKLRRFGVDWALLTGNDFVIQSVSGLINATATQGGSLVGTGRDTMRFGIIDNQTKFGAFIDLLRQNNLAKVLAEPTLVAVSGRPASFNEGGEVPIPVSAGLGVTSVEYREFGTTVDFVPIVLGNGRIKLEVRPQITEIDPALRDPVTGTPGFRSRRVDTGVEMQAGQTLALAGLIQSRKDAENIGIPWLADLPWFGAPFRKVQETINEVELLIMVTPELVSPLDPHEVPLCGPGETTTSPSDVDLYWRGYLEVPRCADGSCTDYSTHTGHPGPVGPTGPMPLFEETQPFSSSREAPQATTTRAVTSTVQRRQAIGDSRLPSEPGQGALVSQPIHGQPAASQPAPAAAVAKPAGGGQYNPDLPHNPPTGTSEIKSGAKRTEPELIGPIGYDVLD